MTQNTNGTTGVGTMSAGTTGAAAPAAGDAKKKYEYTAGEWRAVAEPYDTGSYVSLGKYSNKRPYIELNLRFTEGPHEGRHFRWKGPIKTDDPNIGITQKALAQFGYDNTKGHKLSTFKFDKPIRLKIERKGEYWTGYINSADGSRNVESQFAIKDPTQRTQMLDAFDALDPVAPQTGTPIAEAAQPDFGRSAKDDGDIPF